MSRFLRDNSLLISAPKSTVTLFTPDPKQANTHPKIKISDAELPLVCNPKLMGVYLDTFFSFNTHCVQVANYAVLWSTNARDTSLGKIQRTQNEAIRIITGSHKMLSIDHLHSETKMLPVEDHLSLLSVQYLVHCLDTYNVCHHVGSSTKENEGDTFH